MPVLAGNIQGGQETRFTAHDEDFGLGEWGEEG